MSERGDRTYLHVPFAEKAQAQEHGALWDRIAKKWFAEAGSDLSPFRRWLPKNESSLGAPSADPRIEFLEVLRSKGLILKGQPIMDGQLHRVPVVGDKAGQTSGAYVGYLDGRPAGFIQNFKQATEDRWKAGAQHVPMGAIERARLEADSEEKRRERAQVREQAQNDASAIAGRTWAAARPAAPDHPYLAAKGIKPGELRVGAPGQTMPRTGKQGKPAAVNIEGRLLVPLRDQTGKLWSIQTISADGTKMFQTSGRIAGCHTVLGELAHDKAVIVAEGYATAATLHEATGLPVVAAFTAGNILAVAAVYRQAEPDRTIVVAGDNDHTKLPGKNVGKLKAEEAAAMVGGFALLPSFPPSDKGTDWNDYAAVNGVDKTGRDFLDALRAVLPRAPSYEHSAREAVSAPETAAKSEPARNAGRAIADYWNKMTVRGTKDGNAALSNRLMEPQTVPAIGRTRSSW